MLVHLACTPSRTCTVYNSSSYATCGLAVQLENSLQVSSPAHILIGINHHAGVTFAVSHTHWGAALAVLAPPVDSY